MSSTLMKTAGPDDEIRALRRYCVGRDTRGYVTYEENGVSGTKNSRPALNRMMKDVDDRKIDRVIVILKVCQIDKTSFKSVGKLLKKRKWHLF